MLIQDPSGQCMAWYFVILFCKSNSTHLLHPGVWDSNSMCLKGEQAKVASVLVPLIKAHRQDNYHSLIENNEIVQ